MRHKKNNSDATAVADSAEATAIAERDDATLDGDEAELLQLLPERFSVCDADSANWVVRRVTEAERTVEMAKAWLQRVIRRAERERAFFLYRFGSELESWARTEIAKLKGKRKSLDLPAGSVGYRTQGEKLVVDDESVVVAWAMRHCKPAVVTVQKLSKTALNEHVEETGEVPDGTHVEPKQDVFFIR